MCEGYWDIGVETDRLVNARPKDFLQSLRCLIMITMIHLYRVRSSYELQNTCNYFFQVLVGHGDIKSRSCLYYATR